VKTYEVALRRANGRLVKSVERSSRYRAKLIRSQWEARYDATYYVEIREVQDDE
jgi:hypothetical protein